MYFQQFPKIYYEFEINGKMELRPITDITHNVRFRSEVLHNVSLYEIYYVRDGETPELLSDRFYGTPVYHWVIMLLNERYDYIRDWPLPDEILDEYVNETYTNPLGIHHYERDGIVVSTFPMPAELTIPMHTYTIAYVGNTDWRALTGTPLPIILASDAVEGEYYKIVSLGDTDWYAYQGGAGEYFAVGDIVQAYDVASVSGSSGTVVIAEDPNPAVQGDTIVAKYPTAAGVLHTTGTVQTGGGATAVTNIEYERAINEEKRKIKILAPSALKQVLHEFGIIG